jgi:hypothetical protein
MGHQLGFLWDDMSEVVTGTVWAWMASSKVKVKNCGTVLGSNPLGGLTEGHTQAGKTHLAVSQAAPSTPVKLVNRMAETAAAMEIVEKRIGAKSVCYQIDLQSGTGGSKEEEAVRIGNWIIRFNRPHSVSLYRPYSRWSSPSI